MEKERNDLAQAWQETKLLREGDASGIGLDTSGGNKQTPQLKRRE